jgi:hypothetical protein
VFQAEVTLGVGGIEGVAEDGDSFDSGTTDIWINIRIILDDYKETLESMSPN